MRFLLLVIALVHFCCANSQNQPNEKKSDFRKSIEKYSENVGSLSLIYQGVEQEKYPLNYIGSPYYHDSEYNISDLWYNGIFYPSVKLRLDLFRNQLITQSATQPYNVIVSTEKFDSAQLHGKKLYFIPEIVKNDKTQGAYCLLLHNGKFRCYVQPEIRLRRFTEDQKVFYKFESFEQYYILKSAKYYPVNGIRSLYKIFPNQKNQISDYSKTHKLNFRKKPAESVVEILKNLTLE